MRYLFGPVSPSFVEEKLASAVAAGACFPFGPPGTDQALNPAESWDELCGRLGWQPDFIALWLAYGTVPANLWSAPVPLIGLATDADLLWHDYRHRLRCPDLVLADTVAAARLCAAGLDHVEAANLHGCSCRLLEPRPDVARDVDILFVGNFNAAIQGARLPVLARLVERHPQRRVVLRCGVFGEDYERLLARAKIVVNRSRYGEANRRVFETLAAGALLFQEADNQEVPTLVRDRQECVLYSLADLDTLLEHFLDHDDERARLVASAHARAIEFTFEAQWQRLLGKMRERLPELQARARRRRSARPQEVLTVRSWQALSAPAGADPGLVPELRQALETGPADAACWNALGLVLTRQAKGCRPEVGQLSSVFRRAVAARPEHLVAQLNLVEALHAGQDDAAAADQARRLLAQLVDTDDVDQALLDAGHFPPGYDVFRVEWERAGWAHPGEPASEVRAKLDLLRWRTHLLLAELTDDPVHYYEAYLARPDLPLSHAQLGAALLRRNQADLALPYLRRALQENPFDGATAQRLHQALGAVGRIEEQEALVRQRRRLTAAAPQLVPAEPWFTAEMPDGSELASVILVCGDQPEALRLCLESVLLRTRRPFELLLIDNATGKETAGFLQDLRLRPEPVRVVVQRNDVARGLAAAYNQGLATARGRYLVLLQSDAIVPANWLEELIAGAVREGPEIGLVGAVGNAALPPQRVVSAFKDRAGLEEFAARRRKELPGRFLPVERLAGTLLLRREVYDCLGGLDERFTQSFFEDDYSLRAGRAGYRLRVAQSVYLHRFADTPPGKDKAGRHAWQRDRAQFRRKWDAEQLAVAEPVVGEPVLQRPRVSLTMIVRDEEANLAACLEAVLGVVDEIVVVDTGSTDQTREIARRFTPHLYDFAWIDSFAAARNAALRHATGQWIFWLDADDRLDEENRLRLRRLFAELRDENIAYVMKVRSSLSAGGESPRVLDQVRLFRNLPYIRWHHRIHEQILPAVEQWGGRARWADVVIEHTGYQDAACRRRKLERNLKLLLLEKAEQPEDAFTLFNLGRTYRDLGQLEEALALFRASLEHARPGASIVRKLYAMLAQTLQQRGQAKEALATCREGLERFPGDPELLHTDGVLRRVAGDLAGAEAAWLKLLQSEPAPIFDMMDAGLRSYKTRHLLGLLYLEQRRHAEAEAQWRVALEERQEFAPPWLGLAELLLQQERWTELEHVVQGLRDKAQAAHLAERVTAQVALARKDKALALETGNNAE